MLYFLIALTTNVNVVDVSYQYSVSNNFFFTPYRDIKNSCGVVEYDLVKYCQNGQDLVAYRIWGISVGVVAAKGSAIYKVQF